MKSEMKREYYKNTNKIQKIKWEYFKNLYSSKPENEEEIDQFLGT
jgi:hypothetical protein